jgi:hypothetical protein
MTVTVALELAAADESSTYARALLEACNVGISPGRCVFGQDAAASREGAAVAVVGWDGPTHFAARIEVGFRLRGVPQWQARVISFSAADPEIERWRTAGFAIATLVGEVAAREGVPPKEPSGPAPAPVAPRDTPTIPVSFAPAHVWVDAQFASMGGAALSSPAVGGELRVSSRLGGHWFFFGSAGCTVQRMPVDSLSIVRPGASAGAGLVVLRFQERVELALRGNARVELVEAIGVDPASNATGTGGRWVFEAGEAVDLSWMWSGGVGLVASVGINEAIGATDFTVHGAPVAHLPAVDVGALGGLRFVLP